MRLGGTLQFESKFILPGGEVFENYTHKDKVDDAPLKSESETLYNNYMKAQSDGQSSGKSQGGGLSLTELMANMNWNESININSNKQSEVGKSQQKDSPQKKSGKVDGDLRSQPVVINRETKSLIDEFHDSLHSLMDDKHSSSSLQQQASSEKKEVEAVSSATSEVDVDKVYRKNRRRADVLNRLNGANSGSGLEHSTLEEMCQSLNDISSRPTTAGSTRPSTVFNGLLSGAANALRAAPVNSSSKLSAADEYMRNYRANKSKGALNSQLTKLNLDDLLAVDDGGRTSGRPRSEQGLNSSLKRGGGGGGGGIAGGRNGYGQEEETHKLLGSSSSRMPLSARGRAVIESNMGGGRVGGGNQIGSSIQHSHITQSNQNQHSSYYNSHNDSDDDDDIYSEYGL
jgi:hypothetical protein